MSKRLKVRVGERWYTVEIGDLSDNPVRVLVDGEPVEVDVEHLVCQQPILPLAQAEAPHTSEAEAVEARTPSAVKMFRSPMPGIIVSVSVKEGDQVITGDGVCVLEAMKMQQTLRADWSGIVRAVHVHLGQQVLGGDAIIELE